MKRNSEEYFLQKPVIEFDYKSTIAHSNPFFDVVLDVVFVHKESGEEWVLPAFWRGRNRWSVRFYAPRSGPYQARSVCSMAEDEGLHHQVHSFIVPESAYIHPLYRHGKLGIDVRNKFVYQDGTDFFWLGDTWWMALSDRLKFPEDFETLLRDRKQKGFTVIQLVAGLFPDMDAFDERGSNEAGFPWEKDFGTINPAYFDEADKRIEAIVDAGLTPFIFGAWGYYLSKMGEEKMRRHWRYLIARWSAYPVLWSMAGEVSMPWYLSEDREGDHHRLRTSWSRIGTYIKEIEPYGRLLSAHPVHRAHLELDDTEMLDFEMLQTGHGDLESVRNTIGTIAAAKEEIRDKPIVLSEVTYEGILGQNDAAIQRLVFWIAILSGIDGFTYGVNGIWQVNGDQTPFGDSPNGSNWGDTPWREAMSLPGSRQIALAKRLLEEYDWQHLEPMSHALSHHGDASDLSAPFCAGIAERLRIVYCFEGGYLYRLGRIRMSGLKTSSIYRIFIHDATTGGKIVEQRVSTDRRGILKLPRKRFPCDWIMILHMD